jgi:TatD DNase family protein
MIDSHCHLTASQFDHDQSDVICRAIEQGVSQMICIADSLEESRKAILLAKKYPKTILATIGVHPHHAWDWDEDSLLALRTFAQEDEVVGIGEIGLDYHYEYSPRSIQKKVFEEQLQLARDVELSVIIHSREAIEDTWTSIQSVQPEKLVLHCCTEKFDDVQRFIDAGYYLSFTGIATYKTSDDIRETICRCPLSNIMIETDAPYLAPVPFRGKRNEPAFIVEIARCIADIKEISVDDVERVTDENACRFFGI